MIKTISLFSGSGGLDLGFLKTGSFEVLMANDFNKWACDTYRTNIGDHILCDDIKNIKGIPNVDLIIGGPPCQGFSTANPNRAFEDPRNWLFKEYSRILVESNPKVFLMENVSGMLTLDGGRVHRLILQEFENLGYTVKYKLLDASNYDVPQKRRRLIIVGVRNDISVEYKFPEPVCHPPLFGLKPTVRDAFNMKLKSWEDDPNDNPSKLSLLNYERVKYIPPGGSMKDVPFELQNNSDLKRAMRRLSLNCRSSA